MVGSVPVGGDAPISVQSMTNTPTTDAAATLEQIRQLEEAGADIVRVSCPDEEFDGGLQDHRPRGPRAARGRHPLPLQTRHRGGPGGRRLPAHQPRQHRLHRPGQGGRPGRPRPRLLHAHRRQRRVAGKGAAGEVRRALSGRHGRERAEPRPHPARSGLPRVQDLGEGVRPLPDGRRLSAAGRGHRLPPAPGRHRGRAASHRHHQVGHRHGEHAVGRHRRHHPRLAGRRSGGRDQGRLRHPEIPGVCAIGG